RLDDAARPSRQRGSNQQIVLADPQGFVIAKPVLFEETPLEHRLQIAETEFRPEQPIAIDESGERKSRQARKRFWLEHELTVPAFVANDFDIVDCDGRAGLPGPIEQSG